MQEEGYSCRTLQDRNNEGQGVKGYLQTKSNDLPVDSILNIINNLTSWNELPLNLNLDKIIYIQRTTSRN